MSSAARLALAVLLPVMTACTPGHLHLEPVAEELVLGRGPAAVRVKVPDGLPGGLDVTVRSDGVWLVETEPESVEVAVEVTVENRSESRTARLLVADSRLTDRRGKTLEPVAGRACPADEAVATTSAERKAAPLEPGERRAFDLRFRAPRTDDPRDVVPCRVRLVLAYGDRLFDVQVLFERDDLYDRYRAPPGRWGFYPYAGFGYPWGPYGGLGWGWYW